MEGTKTKTLFTRQNKIILAVLGIVLISAIVFLATLPKQAQADPLKELLRSAEVEQPKDIANNTMKADFITNFPLVPYNGPISSSLQSCINSIYDPYTDPLVQIFFDGETANVIEYYNPNFRDTYSGTVSDIKNELNPVFGHAIRSNSINWLWNWGNRQYNFIVPRSDVKLWTCYFRNETSFFKSFFGYVTPLTAYAVPNMGDIPLNVFFTSEVHFGRAPYTYTWRLKYPSYTGEIIIPLGSTQTYSGSVRYTIRDRGAYTAELKVRSSDNIEKYGYTWIKAGSQPVMPTNVTAWSGYFSNNNVMEVALSWDNVEPTGWYNVYRVQCSDSTCSSTLNGRDLGKFLATGGNRKTIVDNNGLQPNSWYIYYINSNVRGWLSNSASMIVSTGNTSTNLNINSPVACLDTSWSPDVFNVCSGKTVIQTSNCGNTRSVDGQKICTPIGGGSSSGGGVFPPTSSGSTVPSGSGSSL